MVYADAGTGSALDRKISNDTYMYVYVGVSLAFTCFILAGSIMYTIGGYRASQSLHFDTIARLLQAPYSWFQKTPIGRISSRFTADLSCVDIELSFWIDNLSQLGLQFLAYVCVIAYIIPVGVAPVVIATVVYLWCSNAVNRTNREIKREANSAVGPLQSNIVEAKDARCLSQVMGCDAFFVDRHHRLVDKFNRANFCTFALLSWMQMIGVYVSFFIAVRHTPK